MPIELTTAQAEKVAELARKLGGAVWVHQLADGPDVYVGPRGDGTSYLISSTGAASAVNEHTPPPGVEDLR